ncbi:hypothetical protein CsSME_00024981 [Camellia sinensis var. sinensis]
MYVVKGAGRQETLHFDKIIARFKKLKGITTSCCILCILFECRKVVTGSKSPEIGNEEYIGLDDNKYIGDLLAEFKAAKDRSKGEILHCKLTFKKKLFRESDEAIGEPMFLGGKVLVKMV